MSSNSTSQAAESDRLYVGLSTSFHDSSLAIVDSGGRVLFAEATERHLQYKRSFSIAPDTLGYTAAVLQQYCKVPAELVLAFSWTDAIQRQESAIRQWHTDTQEHARRTFGKVPDFLLPLLAYRRYALASHLNVAAQAGKALALQLGRMPEWQHTQVHHRAFDHHLTHAAAACFTSPYEEAVCAVIDGYGERGAHCCYHYRDGKLTELKSYETPARPGSLGSYYQAVCEACGFDPLGGEEWKVMGLAAYGSPDAHLYEILRPSLQVRDISIESCDENTELELRRRLHEIANARRDPLGRADIAHVGQRVFEETLLQFLHNLEQRGLSRNLVLTGGCALNSSANGKILENVPFRNAHVFCAPADDGNSVGAALLAHQADHPSHRPRQGHQSPYLGATLSAAAVANVRRFSGFSRLTELGSGEAEGRGARLLAQNKIIGWIQGRAELGPRALGNRSILADPRAPDIKEEINRRVKFREEFRPFAPAILHEYGPAYFENYQESPYMERALRFREEVRPQVPGVVHLDGTGRLQTVKEEWNPRFYGLIRAFQALTGIPLVLNTSFNVMGKPIAHSVEDVMAVFCTSGLDALVVGDLLIEK